MKQASSSPFCILIAALGGEGGGVLADWLVRCARTSDFPVQATSVPGVAQRTGATSYYIELLREPQSQGFCSPVFALHPVPATLDVVIASELVEAARMMERGFVSPNRTVLISSTHRSYTTLEKMAPMDDRYDAGAVLGAAQKMAQRFVSFDMDAVATQSGTVISAVMFGALAGSGVLPWDRGLCEQVIRGGGQGAEASLRGFARAFAHAAGSVVAGLPAGLLPDVPARLNSSALPLALREAWQEQIRHWPAAMQANAVLGAARCLEYQSVAHATRYLKHLQTLRQANPADGVALAEASRCLALWMCFEDVSRVADLRSRRSRFDKLRQEVGAQATELVRVVEYFKPGIEEVTAILPGSLGRPLMALAQRRGWLGRAGIGLHIRSTSLWGYLLLRGLAAMRPLRPHSMRYQQEHAAIDAWVAAMACCLPHAPEFSRVLAELPAVLKGYSDTQARGKASFERLWQEFVAPAVTSDSTLLPLLDAAAPGFRQALKSALASADPPAAATPRTRPSEQPIRFIKKNLRKQVMPTSR